MSLQLDHHQLIFLIRLGESLAELSGNVLCKYFYDRRKYAICLCVGSGYLNWCPPPTPVTLSLLPHRRFGGEGDFLLSCPASPGNRVVSERRGFGWGMLRRCQKDEKWRRSRCEGDPALVADVEKIGLERYLTRSEQQFVCSSSNFFAISYVTLIIFLLLLTYSHYFLQAVFRIHDILEWIRIRIRGSMPLINESGSCFFRHWPSRCRQKTIFV